MLTGPFEMFFRMGLVKINKCISEPGSCNINMHLGDSESNWTH